MKKLKMGHMLLYYLKLDAEGGILKERDYAQSFYENRIGSYGKSKDKLDTKEAELKVQLEKERDSENIQKLRRALRYIKNHKVKLEVRKRKFEKEYREMKYWIEKQ